MRKEGRWGRGQEESQRQTQTDKTSQRDTSQRTRDTSQRTQQDLHGMTGSSKGRPEGQRS